MSFLRSVFILALASAALAACGDVRESLGLGRSAPDEFAVVERPPLSMPPEFGLRPPTPGAPRPQEVDPVAHASSALFPAPDQSPSENAAAPSDAEKALLAQTGADKAPADIRSIINSEAVEKVDASPHLVEQLLWWKNDQKPGATVDAAAEAARIKQAQQKDEPLNAGATPIIEREKTGWLGL